MRSSIRSTFRHFALVQRDEEKSTERTETRCFPAADQRRRNADVAAGRQRLAQTTEISIWIRGRNESLLPSWEICRSRIGEWNCLRQRDCLNNHITSSLASQHRVHVSNNQDRTLTYVWKSKSRKEESERRRGEKFSVRAWNKSFPKLLASNQLCWARYQINISRFNIDFCLGNTKILPKKQPKISQEKMVESPLHVLHREVKRETPLLCV